MPRRWGCLLPASTLARAPRRAEVDRVPLGSPSASIKACRASSTSFSDCVDAGTGPCRVRPSITTHTGPDAPRADDRAMSPIQHLPPSATSAPQGPEEPIFALISSTSADGRLSRADAALNARRTVASFGALRPMVAGLSPVVPDGGPCLGPGLSLPGADPDWITALFAPYVVRRRLFPR